MLTVSLYLFRLCDVVVQSFVISLFSLCVMQVEMDCCMVCLSDLFTDGL